MVSLADLRFISSESVIRFAFLSEHYGADSMFWHLLRFSPAGRSMRSGWLYLASPSELLKYLSGVRQANGDELNGFTELRLR